LLTAHRVAGGGRPPPAPTERGVRISRTTLFGSWFAASLSRAVPTRKIGWRHRQTDAESQAKELEEALTGGSSALSFQFPESTEGGI